MYKDLDEKVELIRERLDDVSATVHKVDKDIALYKHILEEHFKQDEKMYVEFKRMNDILQQNTDSLKEHMYRTELAEKQLAVLEELARKIDERVSSIEEEKVRAQAISKYKHELVIKIGKVLGIITSLIALVSGIVSLLIKYSVIM